MASNVIRRDVLVGAAACAGALAISGTGSLAAEPKNHKIRIKSLKFKPQNIAVKVGDTICWINDDLAPHTATAVDGGGDTGEIVENDTKSIAVTEGMETNYFCAFHPHMKGTIVLI